MAAGVNGRDERETSSRAAIDGAKRVVGGPGDDSRGANIATPSPIDLQVRGASLHERLARDRRRYEGLVLSRMASRLSAEDAEDIVSESLIRAESRLKSQPPAPGKESAWFARVVLNQAVDFLRARDGRRRPGSRPRLVAVPFDDAIEIERTHGEREANVVDELGEKTERQQARTLVSRVLRELPRRGPATDQAQAPRGAGRGSRRGRGDGGPDGE